MEKEKYQVIFPGKIVQDKDIPEIKRNLFKLFQANASRIDAFFQGREVIVKKNLDYQTALKYIRVLDKAGVECQIRSYESETERNAERKIAVQIEKITRYKRLFAGLVISFCALLGSLSILLLYNYQAILQQGKEISETSHKNTIIRKRIDKPVSPRQGEKISNSLGMEFVYIKPGSFIMGSPDNEPGRKNDEKQYVVTLTKGFYMQTTEVTQGQWKTVMGNNPSYCKECGENSPVEQVSWNDVQEFIEKLNRKEDGNKYRLPTEAEWEFAGRAGSTTAFSNGELTELRCNNDSNLDAIGWYCGNANKMTHPVARKIPNAWGLYDMHGNVYEWCRDWAGSYPSGPVTDPKGPSKGSYRVLRGGSWDSGAGDCRSAHRGYYPPDRKDDRLGFRLLRSS